MSIFLTYLRYKILIKSTTKMRKSVREIGGGEYLCKPMFERRLQSAGVFSFLFGVVQSLAFMAGNMFRAKSVTRETPSISAEPPVKGLHGLWSQTLLVTLFIHFQGRALVRARSGAQATGSLSSVKAITHSRRGGR